jgi:putative glutamine amidotransferase
VNRPVIGISAAIEQARWGAWDAEVLLSPRQYSLAVQRAGGLAVLLSPEEEGPEQLLDLLDGLVIAGGSDVNPDAYGAEPHPQTTPGNPTRDGFELALARGAMERDMPLLGICRGMQVLNVARGGTLQQHLDDIETHRHTPGVFCDHEVMLEAGSLAAEAAGSERLAVKSHHHQGVDRVGADLQVTGRADDGTIEAIEAPQCDFALGVLWHPEEDAGSSVVASLVSRARTFAHARSR